MRKNLKMNAIDEILREVDVDYNAYSTIPSDLATEYPFLTGKTCHEFSMHIALTMVLYATMKYLAATHCKDDCMRQLIGNVSLFSALKFKGGKEMLGNLQQYLADYTAEAMKNGGHLSIPYHLENSLADSIVHSCEKICFPYIHCLVMSTFGNEYPGSSANFFRHFINRAEKRYLTYRPLFDAYYQALKRGETIQRELSDGRGENCQPKDRSRDITAPAKTGCMIPLFAIFSTSAYAVFLLLA